MKITKEIYSRDARIASLKRQLARLSEDFVQVQAGLSVPNIVAKREEFQTLHDELRVIEGKTPRQRQE